MSESVRNGDGKFANGNPGGPGRPRRTVELEYLAALGESVSLADWRKWWPGSGRREGGRGGSKGMAGPLSLRCGTANAVEVGGQRSKSANRR